MSLQKYNQKRDFDKTTEPKGKKNKTDLNRFVIQYHRARAKHYDFRLEHNGVLLSWAVPKGLPIKPDEKRLAVAVEDHPISYIDFEGIIPEGNYGAGTVEIYDKGVYTPLFDMDKGLKKGHIRIILKGKKYSGEFSLVKMEEDNWLCLMHGEESKNKSITLPFDSCKPMLATLSDTIPKTKGWITEIKYDGYRILSFVQNGKVKLVSRGGADYTEKFKPIAEALKNIDKTAFVLDGEVVSFDDKGRSDFGLLQRNIKGRKKDFYYVVFDLIAEDGEDLRELPLIERKKKLERLLYKSDDLIIYSEHVTSAKKCLDFAVKNDLEGIVMKKANSPYLSSRSESWLKIKNAKRQEFVIVGYQTSAQNEYLSAILLGYYDKNELKYIGKVGTGFSQKDRINLNKIFSKITVKRSPIKEKLKENNVVWLSPKLVAEIKFTELTKDGLLRQPSFIGLREDKKPKEITLEYERNSDN